jgi:hypothetical protein
MGIFGINMPMLYGEGERAFIRLQEEIMKVSGDHSLFAWESPKYHGGLLATSPAAFAKSGQIIPFNPSNTLSGAITVNKKGIYLKLRIIDRDRQGLGLAELESKDKFGRTQLSHPAGNGHEMMVKLLLEKGAEPESKDIFGRTPLSHTAGKGHEMMVKLLLEKGVELETKSKEYGRIYCYHGLQRTGTRR